MPATFPEEGCFMVMRDGQSGLPDSQPKTTMKTTPLMILGALAAAASFASAQEKPKRGDGPPVPPEVLEKFDADKDGKLNKEEREAARAAREKEFDKDGKLSEEERKAIPQRPKGDRGPKGDKKGDDKPE